MRKIEMTEIKGYTFISLGTLVIGTYANHSNKLSMVGEPPFKYVEKENVMAEVEKYVAKNESWLG